ncbi:hypothetical protein [Salinibius halmophilus]|uniref:hypothetical protein n=1 Tax=Salinibius halmophilus TaxID=1853216 RepID=UPI000E670A54|nr:hypothetical protein [Salinibius halmophilus]
MLRRIALLLTLLSIIFNAPVHAEAIAGKGGVVVLQYGEGFSGELGAKRADVFRRAARVWADKLVISEPVVVQVDFSALECSNSGAVLGSAGPFSYKMDFEGAPQAMTWYPIALANQLAGKDLVPGAVDIRARFNASIDNGCFNGNTWYYGEGEPPNGQFALFQTVLHELAHGFGFTTVLDLGNGHIAAGGADHYVRHISDFSGQNLAAMSPQQRVQAVKSDALYWHGRLATARALAVSGQSKVAMHAPAQVRSGSSLSHFSSSKVNAAAPEETMQPFYMRESTPWLADAALADMGWGVVWQNEYVELRPSSANAAPGQQMSVQMTISRAKALQAGITAIRVIQSSGVLVMPSQCVTESARRGYCDLYALGEADEVSLPLTITQSSAGSVAISIELLEANEQARASGDGAVVDGLSMTLNFVKPQVAAPEKAAGAMPVWLIFVLLSGLTFVRKPRKAH